MSHIEYTESRRLLIATETVKYVSRDGIRDFRPFSCQKIMAIRRGF